MTDPSRPRGALPIFMQIAETIAREIAAGHVLPGEKLPPEREMAATFNVTVATLRKSLNRLRAQNLIETIQGSGNYVLEGENTDNIYAFFRLEPLRGAGLPTAKLLSLDKMRKPEDLPEYGSSKDAFRFRRVRFLDTIPVAMEEIWLDGSYAESINQDQVSESLYHFYKSKLNHWITRAEDAIGISTLPDWGLDQFELPPGTVCGYIERLAWDQNGHEMERSRTWYDPDKARYIARLK